MVHAQGQPPTGVRGGVAEVGAQPHGDGLQGGKAAADLDRVVTDTAGIEVIHGYEDPHPAVIDGFDANAIGAPELIGSLGHDRARVLLRCPLPGSMGREQVVLAC